MRAILLVFLTLLAGCSGMTTLNPLLEKSPPKTLALLPLNTKNDINRERAEALYKLVGQELRNRGYLLLDNQLVTKFCGSVPCETDPIFSNYKTDATALVEIESISQNNFVAGYYNTISGSLDLSDKEKMSLAMVSHTESESGGVLLQSGQVIQGIIDQIEHTGDEGFVLLAQRFARSVANKLPVTGGSNQGTPAINNISAKSTKRDLVKICATSSEGLLATLVGSKLRSTLRETTPGNYCGIFRKDSLASQKRELSVEIRSPFGASTRKNIEVWS